jgi:quinol monooxygenase YgiN
MNDEVYWIFTLAVMPGQLPEFKDLISRIVAATSKEPDTLTYEYSINDAGDTIHIFERYRSSEAFVTHVEETFSQFAQRFLELVKVTRLVVYGAPSDAAREKLDCFGAVYMKIFDGFKR